MREGTNNSEHWVLARLHAEAATTKAKELSECWMFTDGDCGRMIKRAQIIIDHLERARYWRGVASGPAPEGIET